MEDLGEADDDDGQDDVSDTADPDEGLGTLYNHEADYGIAAE